tara:strand:- start:246 stop:605 length:360 start_codon:yes stop_codon:yes gene_type:complete
MVVRRAKRVIADTLGHSATPNTVGKTVRKVKGKTVRKVKKAGQAATDAVLGTSGLRALSKAVKNPPKVRGRSGAKKAIQLREDLKKDMANKIINPRTGKVVQKRRRPPVPKPPRLRKSR